MELTWEEIKLIANKLDEVIIENFHNAMWNVVSERDDIGDDYEISDEDVLRIKEQLKRII
jgi:ribosome-interacting GTPase 1